MSVDHYENFPVASLLLPAHLREPIAAIYAFARTADDFSDEGDLTPVERLALLDSYRAELDLIGQNRVSHHPVFIRLAPVITAYRLPIQLFGDLLDAFTQDVVKDRYASYSELLDYCRRSANPVGRLLLHLFNASNSANNQQSDAICTALQLINHWQDVAIDLGKNANGRIYLPQDEMTRFGIDGEALATAVNTTAFRSLMAFQIDRTRVLMLSGAPLAWRMPGRIGLELRATVAGGLRILEKIEAVDYDVFHRRPRITSADWPKILWRTLFP
ncbi:MAG: squalene synthase HpnC [Proteobacteria bacterium]|nr:squalene synthase HpnC [Pseudomonadota bacterium]HQR04713.1 squalene synthase HpnC [Rhodocyclaceae bacterium]